MVIWGPLQYSPFDDHPDGGCMVKIAKGPGIKEILYEKHSLLKSTIPHEYFCCQQRNINDSRYSIPNSGCSIKNFTTLALQEVERYTARVNNKHSVETLKGSKTMHIAWNPYNDTTFALSHYLDDYSTITFWFPDDYIHAPECLSRGDDKRHHEFFGTGGVLFDERSREGYDSYTP